MARIIIAIVVLAAVLGGGYFLWQEQTADQPTFEILREAAVSRGPIEATVNATGVIEPEALVSLTFGMAGTVQQINVTRGQMVNAGDLLATLGTEELLLAVRQAGDALRIQQLALEQRRNAQPSSATLAASQADIDAAQANLSVAEANLAAAEASLAQAQAQRARLVAGATNADIAAAQAEIAARTAEVYTVQQQYNTITEAEEVDAQLAEQTRLRLAAAQQALTAAEARLTAVRSSARPADIQAADASIAAAQAQVLGAQGSIAVAQANIARAQAAYDRLLEGPTEEEIAILEAQVASAETNLAIAELRLTQSQIMTPISGVVANVRVNPGELVSPGSPAITIVNEGAFHINVNVDEIDIDLISLGQTVGVTLDALPNTPVAGMVAEIAPTSTAAGGVVTYLVTVNIDAPDLPLRAGMTANAAIVVERVEDVLVAPNWAIRLNRETGQAFVNVLQADGLVAETAVTTGLRNEQFSEVLSGLNEGDRVVVTSERQAFSLFGGP
jgi:HlyD family secretion protein